MLKNHRGRHRMPTRIITNILRNDNDKKRRNLYSTADNPIIKPMVCDVLNFTSLWVDKYTEQKEEESIRLCNYSHFLIRTKMFNSFKTYYSTPLSNMD